MPSISIPRSTAIPIVVQFADEFGDIVDPEAETAILTTSTTGAGTIFTSPGHGFVVNDTVSIAGHGGLPIPIVSSGTSTTALPLVTTITSSAHGMTSGGTGTAADGSTMAAGTFLVDIADVPDSIFLEGIISATSAANPAVITTTVAHGLSDGNFVTVAGTVGASMNISAIVTVTGHNTFTIPASGTAGAGGNFKRAASVINGTYVATFVSSTTFTIPIKNSAILIGGTVTVSTTTPTANALVASPRTITAITADTFTIGALNLTAAGTGGAATKLTDLLLRWTVKAEGQFDGAIIASIAPNAFVKSGSGTTTKFTGSCNYITNELNSLLGIDATISGSISNITGSTFTSSSAHSLTAGDSIVFAAGTIPSGLVAGQTYYILTTPLATTFTISATVAGTVLTPSSSGATVTFVGYPTSDDAEEAVCMAELSWTGAYPSKTNWITHNIRNDLYKADEASPVTTGGYDGKSDIGSGVDFLSVTFPTPLASANWHFLGTPMITNTTLNTSALGLDVVALTARTTAGFTVYFSGQTNASTYDLEWQVRLD